MFFIEKLLKYITLKNIHYFTWIFDFLPKIVFCITFSYDILYCHKFLYSYKIALILLIPLIYYYILYNIKTFCNQNIDRGKDIFIINNIALNEEISIWNYFVLKAREVTQDVNKVSTLFSDNYLLKENLLKYEFGWTQKYIEENQVKFKTMSDEEITNKLFKQYLGLNQIYILMYIYYLRIETYKDIQIYYIRLYLSIIFFIDWLYIILHGLN